MLRLQKSILIVLSFTLSACSQKLIITIDATAPTPVASATPWVAGTEMALASPTAVPTLPPLYTFTPVPMEKPTDFSPVLYGGKFYQTTFFLLLGGVSRDAWLAPDMSVARFAGETTYSLHTMEYEDKYFLWGKAPKFSPICKTYSVGTDADPNEAGMVAVMDGWNVTKRVATELSADNQFYQQVVLDWLTAEGVPAPQVDSLHVYRVDIEGDGANEIFINATHLDGSGHGTKAGDYSIILMRKVAGNDAVTTLVVGDVYRSKEIEMTFPRAYSLANFIDLNQDGILEVIVDIQKWEGFGAVIYQIDGRNAIQSLRSEC